MIKITITAVILLLTLMAGYAFQIVAMINLEHLINVHQTSMSQTRRLVLEMENSYAANSSLIDIWPMIQDLEFEEVKEVTHIKVSEPVFAVGR